MLCYLKITSEWLQVGIFSVEWFEVQVCSVEVSSVWLEVGCVV